MIWRRARQLLAEALPKRYELSLDVPTQKGKKEMKKSLPDWQDLPVRTQMYWASIIVLGAFWLLVEWHINPRGWTWTQLGELVYLAVGVQAANLMPLKMESGVHYMGSLFLMAAALASPGLGVSLVAFATVFDGRRPGREIPVYGFLYNGANYAISYGVATTLMGAVPTEWFWALPLKTLAMTAIVILLNCAMTAKALSTLNHQKSWVVFKQGIGGVTLRSYVIMGLLGGLLAVALMQLVGYVMGIAIFGALFALRSNTADAQAQALERRQTLELCAEALDARDHYTRDHSKRVAEVAAAIGAELGLKGKDVERLRTAGILHDLGKIGIRDEILYSTEKLSEEAWRILKKHPDIGADMIAKHSAMASLEPIVRGHHERWDGRGYPDGLAGEAIPLGARILAVSDSYDTITGPRVYRTSSMTVEEALADIQKYSGAWYDPKVVEALCKVKEPEVEAAREVAATIATAAVAAS